MTPQDYVQQKVAQSGSSFYYAFRFLPPHKRQALNAFYAFCREIDDVVDEVVDPGVAGAKLDWWRREVQNAFAKQHSDHPILKALLPYTGPMNITAQHLLWVIEGCDMDLQQNRYLDFAGLKQYCHLVAGVVGEVTTHILGQTHDLTTAYAHRLGLAMQLTNIIRDVGDDARRGRIYLPIDDLQRFDVRAAEILQRQSPWGYSERFTALMQFQAQRAHTLYDEAFDLLPAADKRAQRVGLAMGQIYRTLLQEIERENFAVLHQRISLTPVRKLWVATRTYWLGLPRRTHAQVPSP